MISGDYASSSDGEDEEVEVEQQETSQLDDDTANTPRPLSPLPSNDPTAVFDDAELLEYEIIVDGEVVGTTHMTPAAARVAMPGSLPLNNNAATATHPTAASTNPRSSSPSVCANCSASSPRYRCPGCSTTSCSLACVTAHKQQSGCTGKRPRSTYVPLHSFTANQLQHDLFFLEEVARNTQTTQRHPLLPHNSQQQRNTRSRRGGAADGEDEEGQPEGVGPFSAKDVSGRYVALQRACVRLGIKLVMPTGMRRHTINSSAWNAREGRLCWRVEWLLDADKVSMHQSHVDGSTTWRDALIGLLTQRDKSTQRAQRREKRREQRREQRLQQQNESDEQQPSEERKEAEQDNTEAATATSGGEAQRVTAHHSDPKLRQRLQQYADAFDSLTLHMKVPMTTVRKQQHRESSLTTDTTVRQTDSLFAYVAAGCGIVVDRVRRRATIRCHCRRQSMRR